MPIPPFEYEPAVQSPCKSYLLAHYGAKGNEYVVILSPVSHPEDFCRPGYPLMRIVEIGNAVDFPTGVILRPEATVSETTIKPETGPLVKHHEIATPVNEDSWLEAVRR